MELTRNPNAPYPGYKPKWLTLLRVLLGIIILLKGISFFQDSASLTAMLQTPGFAILDKNVTAIAFFITYFNLLGGVFLIVGLFTRWIAMLQIPLIIGAIIFVNIEDGIKFSNPELALSLLALVLLIVFLIKGSGTISADEFFRTYTNAGHKTGYTKKFFQ
jgi:uncharacterized membrane protein YphA (DoxX/SURF4 family)